jgi:c-di-AMP phosphodiesterase-like protein
MNQDNDAIQKNIIKGIINRFNEMFSLIDETLIKQSEEKFNESIKDLYLEIIEFYSNLKGNYINLFFEHIFKDRKLILNIRKIHRNMKKIGSENKREKIRKLIESFLSSFNLYFTKNFDLIYPTIKNKEDREKRFLRILEKIKNKK